jgi:hypothetical protein
MSPSSHSRRNLGLADMAGLVVGFGLAALLVRAFWPSADWPSAEVGVVLSLVYLWLGLAMSGPVVLLLDRRAAPQRHTTQRLRIGQLPAAQVQAKDQARPAGAEAEPATDAPARYTRAELAWLSIGAYWIGMTFLVVPARLHDTPLGLVAVLQVVVAAGLWLFGPRTPQAQRPGSSWTHVVAIGVLASWPLAWAALILLSQSVL